MSLSDYRFRAQTAPHQVCERWNNHSCCKSNNESTHESESDRHMVRGLWWGETRGTAKRRDARGFGRDALEGKGPQRPPQRRLGRRLEEVAKAVGGGYCRLQMPLKPALGVRGTVAGHRLGALPVHPCQTHDAGGPVGVCTASCGRRHAHVVGLLVRGAAL